MVPLLPLHSIVHFPWESKEGSNVLSLETAPTESPGLQKARALGQLSVSQETKEKSQIRSEQSLSHVRLFATP